MSQGKTFLESSFERETCLNVALRTLHFHKKASLALQPGYLAALENSSELEVLREVEGLPGNEVGEGCQGKLFALLVDEEDSRLELLVWFILLLLREALVKVLVDDRPLKNLEKGHQDAIGGLLLKGGIDEHSRLQVLQG